MEERAASLREEYELNMDELGGSAYLLSKTTNGTNSSFASQSIVEPSKLHNLLTTFMNNVGGQCHLETLVALMKKHWATVGRFRALFNEFESQRAIGALTKEHATFYVRIDEREPRWSLAEQGSTQSLFACITGFLDQRDKPCTAEEIKAYTLQSWAKSAGLSSSEIADYTLLIIDTDPKIQYDSSKHERTYTVRRRPESVVHVNNNNKELHTNTSTTKCFECGRILPESHKKRKGSSPEKIVCADCIEARKLENDSSDEDSPWICCDACHKWVLAKDDNIDDISIYDDSNPNHLDYFCPKCRAKKAQQAAKAPVAPPAGRNNRKRKHSSVGKDRLDVAEKKLRLQYATREALCPGAVVERNSDWEELEKSFWADIAAFKQSLAQTREAVREKRGKLTATQENNLNTNNDNDKDNMNGKQQHSTRNATRKNKNNGSSMFEDVEDKQLCDQLMEFFERKRIKLADRLLALRSKGNM